MKTKPVKKTKTSINTLLPFFPRSIILKSLFLNMCCLGSKTVNKQVILIFLWLSTKVLVGSKFANHSVLNFFKNVKVI